MKLNKEALKELMQTNFSGNYNRFARELEVDPSNLYRFINTGIGGGKKIFGAIIRYCNENGLDFEQYIEL